MPQVNPTIQAFQAPATQINQAQDTNFQDTCKVMQIYRRQTANELNPPKKNNFDHLFQHIQKSASMKAPEKTYTRNPNYIDVPYQVIPSSSTETKPAPNTAPSPTSTIIQNALQQQVPTVANAACDEIFRKFGEYMAKNPDDQAYKDSWRIGYGFSTCRIATQIGLSIAIQTVMTPPTVPQTSSNNINTTYPHKLLLENNVPRTIPHARPPMTRPYPTVPPTYFKG